MKRSYRYEFLWLNIHVLSIFLFLLPSLKAQAEEKLTSSSKNYYQFVLSTKDINSRQIVSTLAKDLLEQQGAEEQGRLTNSELIAQRVTKVTGVELKQTDNGLDVILTTAAGSQKLVPLILPQGNKLVIDILDATLAFAIRNGVTKITPAPGIREVNLVKIDDSSIRLTITGEKNIPTAEVVPGSNLVLSVTPEGATTEQAPDEEIEVIVTGEGEDDDYYVPDASTATGTDTPIEDTPLSIQVVPQQVLEDRNVTELGDALETVAGVVSASGRGTSSNGPDFLIRGFDGQQFRDGITYFSLAPLSASDIESVEVLKGPASVLFGQGNPGGIINLVSKKPLNEPFYEVSFTAGNFNTYRSNLDFSAPLNDAKTVKYRLNISYENYESFRDFVNGERFLVSPILTWDISPNTSIDFYGQYVRDRETTDEGLVALGNGVVDVPQERFLGEDFGEFEQEQFNLGYRFNHQFNQNLSVRHALEYIQFEPRRFGALADFFDESTGELDRIAFATGGDYSRFFTNAEAIGKFKTGSIKHQLLFGTEYRHDAEDPSFQFPPYSSINVFNPVYTEEPFDFEPEFFRDDNVDTVGVYLQDQIDFLPNLKVLAGVRFDYVDQFRTERNLGEPRTELEQSDSDFTPRFGVVYQPIEPVSLYASYTTSFLAAFPEVDSPTFDPETGRQFEVGVKADIAEQLSMNFAVFDIRKQNVLTQDPENPLLSVQTGELASRGIELSLGGEILPGWDITAGYTYLDAFVSEDNTDIVDNALANVPDNQFSLWTSYELQQGNLEGLGFGLGFLYLSDRAGDLDNSFTLPGFFRTDAALFYERNNWRAQLNIENFFDIDYFSASRFSNSGSRLSVDPGAPFTISGTISVEF
jgi:iron complex outermembrane receptor protein